MGNPQEHLIPFWLMLGNLVENLNYGVLIQETCSTSLPCNLSLACLFAYYLQYEILCPFHARTEILTQGAVGKDQETPCECQWRRH